MTLERRIVIDKKGLSRTHGLPKSESQLKEGIMNFYLSSSCRGVSFSVGLNNDSSDSMRPLEVTMHSCQPVWGTRKTANCPVLRKSTCYYDIWSINNEDLVFYLEDNDEEGLWKALNQVYDDAYVWPCVLCEEDTVYIVENGKEDGYQVCLECQKKPENRLWFKMHNVEPRWREHEECNCN